MNILVINAGSSSLKYQLMNPDTGDIAAKGLCERIGLDGRLTHKVPASGKKVEKDIPMPTHKEAIEAVMAILVDPVDGVIKSVDEIDAVGHRVLHGGDKFVESCIIDEACKQAIRDCNLAGVCAAGGNALEHCSGAVETPAICKTLREHGAVMAQMTGSGAAVFGIFDDENAARSAVAALKNGYKQVYLCKPTHGGPHVTLRRLFGAKK